MDTWHGIGIIMITEVVTKGRWIWWRRNMDDGGIISVEKM